MKIKLNKNERIDDLEISNMKIIQNKDWFCFGMDSVLLSDFAKEIKEGSRCVDLGTGTGILGILLCAKTNLSEIVGIEVQKEVANMAKRSIKLNNLENRFKILNINVKEIIEKKIIIKDNIQLEKNSFDYVITNPPYKKINTGKINENENKKISKHEYLANLDDFIETTNYLLKDKGTLYLVHRPDRLVDIIEKLRNKKIEIKEMKFIYPKVNSEPNLVLIKAIKNARPFLKILKPIYIYDDKGNYTNEILKIYGK